MYTTLLRAEVESSQESSVFAEQGHLLQYEHFRQIITSAISYVVLLFFGMLFHFKLKENWATFQNLNMVHEKALFTFN